MSTRTLEIFYCYAHEDEGLLTELEKRLYPLKRDSTITSWHRGEIIAGKAWEKEVTDRLNTAHVIILLVSPDFLASDYCVSVEMQHALERHRENEARVIPVILRPTHFWKQGPLAHLSALPTNEKPVTGWPDRDYAFDNIAIGLEKVIKDLQISLNTGDKWLADGIALSKVKRYKEALDAYDKALYLEPHHAHAHARRGGALCNLRRYEEALLACDEAIRLNAGEALAYYNKGEVLSHLERYAEALRAFEEVIRLEPGDATVYYNKGITLTNLEQPRYREAIVAYDKAIDLNPNYADAYYNKGNALLSLEAYDEAIEAYDRAIELNPYDDAFRNNRELARFKRSQALS